jgi:hypothetical protein
MPNVDRPGTTRFADDATIAYIKRLEDALIQATSCVRFVSYGVGPEATMAHDLRREIERDMPHLFNNEEKPHA